jgi:outer membrane protease
VFKDILIECSFLAGDFVEEETANGYKPKLDKCLGNMKGTYRRTRFKFALAGFSCQLKQLPKNQW